MSRTRRHRSRADSAAAPVLVLRLDRAKLAEPVVLPTGGKRIDGVLAHVGILSYTHADDPSIPRGTTRREFVRADSLSDPAFLDALRGLPVTVEHVPGASPRNMARVRVGTILAAHFDAETGEVRAEIVVDDQRGLDALSRGLTDVSLGYDVEIAETPGEWTAPDGTTHRYDAEQVRRVPNHLALTRKGRAGQARVRADGATMDPTKLFPLLAGLGITVPEDADEDAVAAAVKAQIDTVSAERDTARADAVRIAEEAAAEKAAAESARADATAAAVADLDAATRKGDGESFRAGLAVRARFDALAKAHKVDGAGLDTTALGRAIVKAAVPGAPDDMSDAYVSAAIDMLASGVVKRADARFDVVRRDAVPVDSHGQPAESATDRQRKAYWSTPASTAS